MTRETPPKQPVEKVIDFWEVTLSQHKWIMDLTTPIFIEDTIKYLKMVKTAEQTQKEQCAG